MNYAIVLSLLIHCTYVSDYLYSTNQLSYEQYSYNLEEKSVLDCIIQHNWPHLIEIIHNNPNCLHNLTVPTHYHPEQQVYITYILVSLQKLCIPLHQSASKPWSQGLKWWLINACSILSKKYFAQKL